MIDAIGGRLLLLWGRRSGKSAIQIIWMECLMLVEQEGRPNNPAKAQEIVERAIEITGIDVSSSSKEVLIQELWCGKGGDQQ